MTETLVLRVKNWSSFQHYKDRSPSWIKLHKSLLDDYEFQTLPIAARALAPMLWLLASETPDGLITATVEKLSFRLRVSQSLLIESLIPLIKSDFVEVVEDASGALAGVAQSASREKRREENIQQSREEKNPAPPDGGGVLVVHETKLSGRDAALVYGAYPRKIGKHAALNAIEKASKRLEAGEMDHQPMTRGDALGFLLQRCAAYARAPAGKAGNYTPHPATWFNRSSYLDDEQEWWKVREIGNGSKQVNTETGNQRRRRESDDALYRATAGNLARIRSESDAGNQRPLPALPAGGEADGTVAAGLDAAGGAGRAQGISRGAGGGVAEVEILPPASRDRGVRPPTRDD